MKKPKYLWLKISKDKYELPLAVADTADQLAEMCGVTVGTIRSNVKHFEDGDLVFSRYRKVKIRK